VGGEKKSGSWRLNFFVHVGYIPVYRGSILVHGGYIPIYGGYIPTPLTGPCTKQNS
jgi:hypothetical protein